MEVKVQFKPEQVILDGTVVIRDKDNKVIDEYKDTFAYKWDEFDNLIDLLH